MATELGEPCSAYKASTAEKQRNETRLRKVIIGDNLKCADCMSPIEFRNAWASINLGMFYCIRCSGIHRQMGVHISKVRAVQADDWNDDWVDNMTKWGNARGNAYWEAAAPLHRPLSAQPDEGHALTTVAGRGIIDYIRAKYQSRTFVQHGVGEPTQWLTSFALANGWARHYDSESNSFFYANGETTVWEVPEEAVPPRPPPAEWWAGHEGWLEKKSGGKEGIAKAKLFQKWDKRYFVLGTQATLIVYYKSDEAFRKKEAPLGSVSLTGASGFLKEVSTKKGEVHRWTLLAPERELKLRCGKAEFQAWAAALRPVCGDISKSKLEGGGDDDDDDDD